MPFIRYAIGDVGVRSNEKCPCGRTLPLMKVVEGRKDSLLHLPDGRVLSPMAFRIAISRFFGDIMQYRVIQKKLDLFQIYIRKNRQDINEEVMETELVAHISKIFRVNPRNLTFQVDFVEEIPLEKTGKLKAVVSEL
jgi:phenylacetate-CoA ligase